MKETFIFCRSIFSFFLRVEFREVVESLRMEITRQFAGSGDLIFIDSSFSGESSGFSGEFSGFSGFSGEESGFG